MALARCNLTIQDEDGNIIDGASVEVRNEDTLALPQLYSDRAGTAPLGNAFTAADGAAAGFHVIGGVYKITATLGAFERVWRYVGIGTASEFDSEDLVSNFTQSGTGAVTRSSQTKLREFALTPQDFGAIGDSTTGLDGTDDTAALAALFTAAVAQNKPIYLPKGGYRTTASLALSALIPIFGDGKTRSRIFYSGAAMALLIVPPTVGTMFTLTNDGHWFRDFSIEPAVDGGGTYGVELRLSAGQYAYSTWDRVRIGNFGTRSLWLNNTINLTDGFFTSAFVDCDFLNSVLCTLVGDNVHFERPKFHGSSIAAFSMQAGARRLRLIGGSYTNTGGMIFESCDGVELHEPHVEVFSGSNYSGGNSGLIHVLDTTNFSIKKGRIAKVGTGTKPDYQIALAGTTANVIIDGVEMAMGNTGHINAASTTSDVYVANTDVDEGYANRVVNLAGARSREVGGGVLLAGNADATIKPYQRVVLLIAALSTNRTLTLPLAANVEDDHLIEFLDAAGGLGSFSWIIARAGADTIQGATSLTVGTQLGRFFLRKVDAATWTYGITPIGMGGTGANSASAARTNLGLAIGTNVQAFDADLSALAANSTDGLWAHTGSGTGAARTLTAPAAGLTISNPAGIAGNPTFALANDLAALEALSGTNTIYYRSGSDAWSSVTIGATLSFSAGTLNLASPLTFGGNVNVPSGASYQYNSVSVINAQTALNNFYLGGAGNFTGTGTYNFGEGPVALGAVTSGSYNMAMGSSALGQLTTGLANAAMGVTALQALISGNYNVGVGYLALYQTTGTGNVQIGAATDVTSRSPTSGNHNVLIGYDVGIQSQTANDQLCISNFIYGVGMDGTATTISAGKIGFGVKAPTAVLHLAASSTARASLCIPTGAAPTSPVIGDFWLEATGATGFKFRDSGGVTRTVTAT